MSASHGRSDTIVAVLAVVIAAIAIVVSVTQGIEQRRHNRLTVKPALNFEEDVAVDRAIVSINLKNGGTGPAVVKRFIIYVDDRPVQPADGDVWGATLTTLNLTDPNLPFLFYIYEPGDVIAAGEKESIFIMQRENYYKLKDKQVWKQAMLRVKIKVDYASIYEEEFQAQYHPLKTP